MEDQVELRWVFSVIRRRWWFILACSLLGATIAFAVSSRKPPVYSASVTLLVQQVSVSGVSDYTALRASELLAGTYSKMLSGIPVLEATIAQLDLNVTPGALAKRIKVELVSDTQLIRLRVEHTSPTQAALIANTIADAFTAHIQALNTERYTGSFSSMQEKMGALLALIEGSQSEIDTLSTRKIGKEVDLARQESLLGEYRSESRELQQDYQTLQLTVAQLADSVNVVEAAQVPESQVLSPYTATVSLLVDQTPAREGDHSVTLATYGQMLVGRPVLEAAIAQLGLRESPDTLAKRVRVEPVTGTQLIQLSVEDPDVSGAILLADTIVETFIGQIQAMLVEPYAERLAAMQLRMDKLPVLVEQTQAEIETLSTGKEQAEMELARLESLSGEYRSDHRQLQQDYEQLRLTTANAAAAVVIDAPAQAPESPIQRRSLYTTLAAAVGLMVSVGLVFLLEYMDDTIKTPEDISQMLGLETLGIIGQLTIGQEELVVETQPLSPAAEAFRVLSTNARLSGLDRSLKSILITSPGPKEGKSIVAANLAMSMAQAGFKVIVVDADFRNPRLHKLYGLQDGSKGLTSALREGIDSVKLHNTKVRGLVILTSGELPQNPALILAPQRIKELLTTLMQTSDVVLIDSPPVLPVADSVLLAQAVDGVLFVIKAGHTRRDAARRAIKSMRLVGVKPIGVVLNAVSTRNHEYSSYYLQGAYGNGYKNQKLRWSWLKERLISLQKPFAKFILFNRFKHSSDIEANGPVGKKSARLPYTTAEQRKLLFEIWETTGDVREACRKAQVSRGTFYYWKPRFVERGYKGLEYSRTEEIMKRTSK